MSTLHRGDRVMWLPYWIDDETEAKAGVITSTRKSLAPYDCSVRLDEDPDGWPPLAAYYSELQPILAVAATS